MMNLETLRPPRGRDGRAEAVSDAVLVMRWSTSADGGALEVLVRRHGAMVLGVCQRVLGNTPDADDAFQATFLLLVRKARSLAYPEQVAGWLHAVALRVARKARSERARRQLREVAVVELAAPTPSDDSRELRQVLDEELDRLPEKYRLPIVLCELEGRTLEEAARLLGWPKGTVAGRLSRGRDLLRQRLSRRRGLFLPLFVVGGALPSDRLVSATVSTATSPAPSRPATLADLALRGPRGWLGIVLLLLVTSGALGAFSWHGHGAGDSAGSPAPASGPAKPGESTPATTPPRGAGCHSPNS